MTLNIKGSSGLVAKSCLILAATLTVACYSSLSMDFPSHTGVGLPSPSSEFSDPGIEPTSPNSRFFYH